MDQATPKSIKIRGEQGGVKLGITACYEQTNKCKTSLKVLKCFVAQRLPDLKRSYQIVLGY